MTTWKGAALTEKPSRLGWVCMYGQVTHGVYTRPKRVRVRTRECVLVLALVGEDWIPQDINSFWLEPDKNFLVKLYENAKRRVIESRNRFGSKASKVVVEIALTKPDGYVSKGRAQFRVLHPTKWKAEIRAWHRKGDKRAAAHRQKQQAGFMPLIMAPKRMEQDGNRHQFAAADISLDKDTAIREAAADHAREIMTLAEFSGFGTGPGKPGQALAWVLAHIVEGQPLNELASGVLMDKYEKFAKGRDQALVSMDMRRHIDNGHISHDVRTALVRRWRDDWKHPGWEDDVPLPLAMRNNIAHRHDKNSYTLQDVLDAIRLLNHWLGLGEIHH